MLPRFVRPGSAPGLASWLLGIAPPAASGEVAIALVSDARIRVLNREFRRKDAVTDVLAFPAGPSAAPGSESQPLGDIVIALGQARRQAREAGHSLPVELKILALHGLLHLLGYDHHHRADLGRMARLERRLRAQGGLAARLIERARASRTRTDT